MNLALSTYVGNGSYRNPFRTKIEGAAIDLRPDCAKREGYALVNTEERVRRRKLGEGFKDTFGFRVRNKVHDLLGVDVSRVKRFDVLAAKLLMEPNGWGALRPALDRYEIWLGGLVWEFPLISGGASDNFNRADGVLTAPWTKLGGNDFTVASNAMKATGASDADSMWVYAGSASGADQYIECTTVATMVGDGGPIVRGQNVGGLCGYTIAMAISEINKFLTGAFTTVSTISYSTDTNPGDSFGLRAVGSTLTAYKVGVGNYGGTNPVTETSIPGTGGTGSGLPGFYWFDRTTSVDNWIGDNYPPTPSTPQVLSMQPHISGHGVW
jgi:hypothetical protein